MCFKSVDAELVRLENIPSQLSVMRYMSRNIYFTDIPIEIIITEIPLNITEIPSITLPCNSHLVKFAYLTK